VINNSGIITVSHDRYYTFGDSAVGGGGGYIISIMELEPDKSRREMGDYMNWTRRNLQWHFHTEFNNGNIFQSYESAKSA
jgi:hypothetical protein